MYLSDNVANTFQCLSSFIQDPQVVDFADKCSNVLTEPEYPRYNYIGFNFSKGELTDIKLYFTFFQKLDIAFIQKILPTVEHFQYLYPHFNISRKLDWQNTGCAFSIKWNNQNTISKGFHLRIKSFERNPIFTPPVHINLSNEDIENSQGICYEYDDDRVLQKNYYYISDISTKRMIANRESDIAVNILNASIIEYTESNNGDKIILWYDKKEHGHNIQLHKTHQQFNEMMRNDFNLLESFSGKYIGIDKYSSYFSSPIILPDLSSADTFSHLKNKLSL